MHSDRFPCRLTITINNLNDLIIKRINSGRQYFLNNLSKIECRKGCFLAGLNNNNISCCQGRRCFPGDEHERVVPWYDGGCDSKGLVFCVDDLVGLARDELGAELICPTCVIFEGEGSGCQVIFLADQVGFTLVVGLDQS